MTMSDTQPVRRGSAEWGAVLAVLAQWMLAAIVMVKLDVMNAAFHRVFMLVGPAFLINHLLPTRLRLSYFILVCFVAAMLVLGGVPGGGWSMWLAASRTAVLTFIAAVLIGICLLRARFWLRAALLGVVALALGAMRAGVLDLEPLRIIWPVLASLFMFRLLVYFHDVSVSRERPVVSQAIAYFALFPNFVSQLFPIVDFKAMVQGYYSEPATKIYLRGAKWIIRGLLQLVLYRLVLQLITLEPKNVDSGTDVFLYVVGSTFVYLQVSGLFHLLIGTLLLFGFNLPETNKRYFFATSFTDYWRRVNIYWKDFILKIFYFPMYFRLKDLGTTIALVVATLWSFFVTWFLHLYQTWWLKGEVSVRWTDTIFWSALAILVLLNSLGELKRGRQRRLGGTSYSLKGVVSSLLATGGTFIVISTLWSLWNAPTLSAWIGVWRQFDASTFALILGMVASVMMAKFLVEIAPATALGPVFRGAWQRLMPMRAVPEVAAPGLLVAVMLLSIPGVQARIATATNQVVLDALVTTETMTDAMGDQNRGYYQALASPDHANIQLWETMTLRSATPRYQGEDPMSEVNDFRFQVPLANIDTTAYHSRFVTNSHGMRDREYSVEKPDDVVRIALLGSSHAMGWGVAKEATFEAILENRLNAAVDAKWGTRRFELLNFAYNRLGPLGHGVVLREVAAKFQPDLVLLVAHSVDFAWTYNDLMQGVRSGVVIESEFLKSLIQEGRITSRTHAEIGARRIEHRWTDLLEWSYRQIEVESRRIGAVPLAVLLPVPHDYSYVSPDYTEVGGELDKATLARRAVTIRKAGLPLLDLSEAFEESGPQKALLTDGLLHTNEYGHQVFADLLYTQLTESPQFAEIINVSRPMEDGQ